MSPCRIVGVKDINISKYLLMISETTGIVVDPGEEWRLDKVNSEVAGLERWRSIVSNCRDVLIKTPEKVIERCKFSIVDHRLRLGWSSRKDAVKLRFVAMRILEISCIRNIIRCLEGSSVSFSSVAANKAGCILCKHVAVRVHPECPWMQRANHGYCP